MLFWHCLPCCQRYATCLHGPLWVPHSICSHPSDLLDTSDQTLHPIPLRMKRLRTNGVTPNNDDSTSNDLLVRRMVLFDTLSGVSDQGLQVLRIATQITITWGRMLTYSSIPLCWKMAHCFNLQDRAATVVIRPDLPTYYRPNIWGTLNFFNWCGGSGR